MRTASNAFCVFLAKKSEWRLVNLTGKQFKYPGEFNLERDFPLS